MDELLIVIPKDWNVKKVRYVKVRFLEYPCYINLQELPTPLEEPNSLYDYHMESMKEYGRFDLIQDKDKAEDARVFQKVMKEEMEKAREHYQSEWCKECKDWKPCGLTHIISDSENASSLEESIARHPSSADLWATHKVADMMRLVDSGHIGLPTEALEQYLRLVPRIDPESRTDNHQLSLFDTYPEND